MPFLPNVPRWQHLKVNGTQCGSPALKRNRFCFFHKRFQEEQIKLNCDRTRRGRATFLLPVLEDANSIQISLMQIMRLLASGQMDPKIAGLLLFALQTASYNLRRTTFEPIYVKDVVIDRRTIDQTCIGGNQWSEEDFPSPELAEEEKAEAAAEEAAEAAAAAAIAARAPPPGRKPATTPPWRPKLIGLSARVPRKGAPSPCKRPSIPTCRLHSASRATEQRRRTRFSASTARARPRSSNRNSSSPCQPEAGSLNRDPPSPHIRKTQQEESTQERRFEPNQRKNSRQGSRLGHEYRQAPQPAGITER